MKANSALRSAGRLQNGFSLIELLVAMAIGLVLSLAVSKVLVYSQEARLSTTATNDTGQTGSYLNYVLDRTVRSAGSGFAQRRANFGCLLDAWSTVVGAQVLPRTSALPPPFASVTSPFRLAPLVIFKSASSAGSDVIAVMTGSAGYGESALPINLNSSTGSQIGLPNTIGFSPNDMLLLTDESLAGCMVQQVASSFAEVGGQTLPMAGPYFKATINGLSLTSFGTTGTSYASSLGRGPASASVAATNPPQFQLFGVGANNVLFSYDLLQLDGSGTSSVPMGDGVVEMRAIYEVDTTGDGKANAWKDPGEAAGTAGYNAADLLDGSAGAQARLATILAVRIGLILRTQLSERAATGSATVSRPSYTLFAGLPGSTTRTPTGTDLNFRYRTLEFTVPLRNSLMPKPP